MQPDAWCSHSAHACNERDTIHDAVLPRANVCRTVILMAVNLVKLGVRSLDKNESGSS
jgi:hypothetical protein